MGQDESTIESSARVEGSPCGYHIRAVLEPDCHGVNLPQDHEVGTRPARRVKAGDLNNDAPFDALRALEGVC